MQEFLEAFTSSFLAHDMTEGTHEVQWGPSTLVRLDPSLVELTKVGDYVDTGRTLMQRSEVTDSVWQYIEENFLGERVSLRPAKDTIELDKRLAQVFGLPEAAGDDGGGKKKKKKDGEMPELMHWQFAAMMDAKIDSLLVPVFKARDITTPSAEDVGGRGLDEENTEVAGMITSLRDTWAVHGLDLNDKGCAPGAAEDVGGAELELKMAEQEAQRAAEANGDATKTATATPQEKGTQQAEQGGLGVTQYLALDLQVPGPGQAFEKRFTNIGPDIVPADVEAVTPRSAFLAATQEQQLLPLPLPLMITPGESEDDRLLDEGATVELCGHSLGHRYTGALATALRRFHDSYMTTFSVAGGGLDDAKGAQLIQAIAHQTELTTLDLSHNVFGKATVKELEALLVPPMMEVCTVSLRSNRLGDAGVQLLATSLTSGQSWSSEEGLRHYPNKTVRVLDLRDNGIGFTGASSLASVLNVNGTIHELAIGSNTIGTSGCLVIAEALENNGAIGLRVLDFSHCQIGGESDSADRVMLKNGGSKQSTQAKSGDSQAGAKALLQAFQENDALRNQLEQLDVRHNSLSSEMMSEFVELLGDKVKVGETPEGPEAKPSASAMFGQMEGASDHLMQERDAMVVAEARAVEKNRLAAERLAAETKRIMEEEVAYRPAGWSVHAPGEVNKSAPRFDPAGFGVHYPSLNVSLNNT